MQHDDSKYTIFKTNNGFSPRKQSTDDTSEIIAYDKLKFEDTARNGPFAQNGNYYYNMIVYNAVFFYFKNIKNITRKSFAISALILTPVVVAILMRDIRRTLILKQYDFVC